MWFEAQASHVTVANERAAFFHNTVIMHQFYRKHFVESNKCNIVKAMKNVVPCNFGFTHKP